MMKRVLSLFLSTVLLITSLSFSVSAQAQPSAYNSEDAGLLYALGVTESSDLTGASVTRAQFVRYAMKLAAIPITPYKGTGFADVPQTHPDYSYIMSAVDFGLISIADNFRPEDTIAPNEAVKIMVELLGYDFMAEAKGGYPTGYLQTAQSIDLLDDVDASNLAMSEYDVCTLLCNALSVFLPEVSYSDEGADQYRIGTATILSHYRGIIEVRGIVDGVSHYSEYNASGLGDNNISINGVTYYTGELNCDSLFGYDVVAYFDSKAKKLISCTPSDSNRTLSVYAEDVESFADGTFVYTDKDSKSRSVSINIDTTIFYNGRIFDYDSLKMIPESGSLNFVSSNGSGSYSTLYIKSYKTIVVNRTFQGEEYIIVDKYSGDNSLVINPDTTNLVINDQDGNELTFSSILTGDVINAAVSDDKKLVELICVKDEILGTYSGHSNDYIEVDGTAYRLSSSLEGKVSDIISIGKQAIFRLDIDHRIADIIPSAGGGEEIGYLVVGKVYENGFTSSFPVRILNLDGKIYDYYFADAFTINGKAFKDFKTAYDTNKSPNYDSLPCSVVKYAFNDEGKIKSLIYSDEEGGEGGLYLTDYIEESSGSKLSQWFNSIGNQIITNTGTIIFKVPNPIYSVNSVDDDLYSVEKAQIFYEDNSTKGYKLVGYTTNPDDGMSSYLLAQKIADDMGSNAAIDSRAFPYMVSSVSKVLIDGEPREKMELCNETYPVSSPLVVYSKSGNDFSLAGINGGDIVRININERNMVRGLEIVWKKGSSTFADGSTDMSPSSELNTIFRVRMAYAYAFRTDVLDAVNVNISPDAVTRTDKMPLYVPDKKVFKYDDRLNAVVEMSVDEIKDYKNFGDNRSWFIYHKEYEATQSIFLVK